MFEWMYWTLPTTCFFIGMAVLLTGLGVWEHVSSTGFRRGYLIPMKTTRGDRLFISLLSLSYIAAIWVGYIPLAKWILVPIAFLWIAVFIAVG